MDTDPSSQPSGVHQPFTPAERIRQLSTIDQDIPSILVHLSSALRALATPPGTSVQPPPSTTTPGSDAPLPDATDPVDAFRTAQSAFFNTVDRIDKHLTRQILALEEAGIVSLRGTGSTSAQASSQDQQQQIPGEPAGQAQGGDAKVRQRLGPDGMGRYGTLDVGKLNLVGSTVERDMEGGLWREAREGLEKIVAAEAAVERDKMEE
ncbi:mediator complex, subunit Med11 [Staphylotrichum tortipilum]|uniref:Mediator of RNA polymerase II transcription subunit 11 n=1 Tax=Staphylotrichum tortipilum TaxID=2831512 RepID=A0AAN6MDF3_9PEZI|nr:mediator complex, subunit Med11 [Staphylotrichum longicolle]